MLLSSLTLVLLPILAAAARPRCLPSGDERAINTALRNGGKGAVVSLCPGSVHRLNGTVYFTAQRQTLTTLGDPLGRDRALLIVEGANQATAVQADCDDCSYATIKSIEVDGNRPLLLRIPKGAALIETGNGEGHTVKDCKLYEPRGWSALHLREGNRKQCRNGLISGNDIGPCGEEWDYEYDGVTDMSPWGNPQADGISVACKDSIVEKNIVTDTTDGGIVLFGSSGTEVRDNDVYARTRVILGGINMVDYDPWDGDYKDTKVHHNRLHALGRYFKTGIVIGPASWSDEIETIVKSGVVTDNIFDGAHFGYGIVISSADDFTVLRNTLGEGARFAGVPGIRCPRAPGNGKPTAFLINRGSAKGTFQTDFVNGEVQHIICIQAPDENGRPYKAWRLRDSPAYLAAKAAEAARIPEGFDARLAEALVTYQASLLASVDQVTALIDASGGSLDNVGSQGAGAGAGGGVSSGSSELERLVKRLDALEKGDKKLRADIEGIQEDFGTMASELKSSSDERRSLLEQVLRFVASLSKVHRAASRGWDDVEFGGMRNGTLGSMAWFAAVAVIGLGAVSVVRRWRAKAPSKGSKVF
ncbi:hypothetical protein EHS25_002482 [Saitozyma podzolica]|uniref:Right handed beta helix domain-containing protein n=1 Tax=Saitozyma podzolica TaxID=1890683 RepID=A0A427YE30_9TREE|nr:hypothetical protein EHS25_002482 [Saitozyma podzolica]